VPEASAAEQVREPARPGRARPGLRSRPFTLVFAAFAVSTVGTQVSLIALPLAAVTKLHASAAQVGLLGTLGTIGFLLVGLPAGVLVDRVRRRRVMMAADLSRAVVLATIPLAWWFRVLTLPQMYAVVFVSGIATVFFDVSSQSYLPSIVAPEHLVRANTRLASWDATSSIAGPSIAGYLVQLITAPVAVVVNVFSFLWSAACLMLIRGNDPRPRDRGREDGRGDGREQADGREQERRMAREIREGLGYVFSDSLLRPIMINGAATNLSAQIIITMLPLMIKRELGLSAGTLGLFFALDGAGMLLGSVTARRIGLLLGQGPAVWIIGILVIPACVFFPLVNHGPWLWIAGASWLVLNFRIGINNVILVTFCQRVTPHRLLGRMNATMRFLLFGSLSVGAAVSGLIGEFVGVRAALWTATAILALVWLPIFFSPLRNMRELPKTRRA
jgi:MFS family permease